MCNPLGPSPEQDELVARRAELGWIIEGDFDRYCSNMR